MDSRIRPLGTVDDLIAALEAAATGSRTLDVQLAYCLGEAAGATAGNPGGTRLPAKWHALGDFPAIAKIMLDEGFSWQSVCDVLDCEAPSYTTSLDAGIPGENIVFVIRSAKRDRWGAIHKTAEDEEVFGWAATEILARRAAALKGWKARIATAKEKAAAAAEPDQVPAQRPQPEASTSEAEHHGNGVNGETRATRPDKSLEQAMAEQEDRDWEILF